MASNEGTATAGTSTSARSPRREDTNTIRRPQEPMDGSELPFLVTHWLQNFNPNANANAEGETFQAEADTDNNTATQRRAALERIRRATSELASAFTALGAYGESTVVSSRTVVDCSVCCVS